MWPWSLILRGDYLSVCPIPSFSQFFKNLYLNYLDSVIPHFTIQDSDLDSKDQRIKFTESRFPVPRIPCHLWIGYVSFHSPRTPFPCTKQPFNVLPMCNFTQLLLPCAALSPFHQVCDFRPLTFFITPVLTTFCTVDLCLAFMNNLNKSPTWFEWTFQ